MATTGYRWLEMTTKSPSGFHYFVYDGMNRSEEIQAWVVNTLLNSKLPQEKRESSVQFELKHSSAVTQFAKLLAQKRGVDDELAAIAAALHDVQVIINGTYKDHAKLGGAIARQLMKDSGNFIEKEIKQVEEAIAQHSDKHVYSNNGLVEVIKDADTLDCFFYGDKVYDYKEDRMVVQYYKRIISVREELGLPEKPYFKEQLKIRVVC